MCLCLKLNVWLVVLLFGGSFVVLAVVLLFVCLFVCLVGWLIGRSVGRSVGWLVVHHFHH